MKKNTISNLIPIKSTPNKLSNKKYNNPVIVILVTNLLYDDFEKDKTTKIDIPINIINPNCLPAIPPRKSASILKGYIISTSILYINNVNAITDK